MNNITTLFCDLGGVLILNNSRRIYDKYQHEFGIKTKSLQNIFIFQHGGNKTEEEIKAFVTNQNIDYKIWQAFLKEFFDSEKRNFFLYNLVINFKKKGGIVIITTNNKASNNEGLLHIFKKYKLEKLKNNIILSANIGIAKPEFGFWEEAFKLAVILKPDIKKEEILVIDDSVYNCSSAVAFGLQSFHYTENKNQELKPLLNRSQV